jgi:hypothetical protein
MTTNAKHELIFEDLRNIVLINPPKELNADTLYVISGYTSANYAKQHLDELTIENNLGVTVNLLIGMRGDLDEVKKIAYCDLEKTYGNQFRAYCVDDGPNVHSKMYAWFLGNTPVIGFAGSANYSEYGFPNKMTKQRNQLTEANPIEIKEYFTQLLENSIPVQEKSVKKRSTHSINYPLADAVKPGKAVWLNDEKTKLNISLLRPHKRPNQDWVPEKSGLNWELPDGNPRRKYQDDPTERWRYDAAYLKVPKMVHTENPEYFPERDSLLTLLTDDNEIFYCSIQQDHRKAITTTNETKLGNRQLGLYLRRRLGVAHGADHPRKGYAITLKDLERYGRTYYTIEKIADESYLFDFSKP